MSAHAGEAGAPAEQPSFWTRHRRAIAVLITALGVAGFVIFLLPQITGLSGTLHRLRNASPSWVALGIVAETLSLGSYVALFRAVFSCDGTQIGLRESAQITLAGTVASKLLAAAGAGGVALTVWALRASGLPPNAVARRMLTFELLLYSVFAGAIVLVGAGLRVGLLAGAAPWTLTVVPAAIGAGLFAGAALLWAVPFARLRRLAARAERAGWLRRLVTKLLGVPQMLRGATAVAAELIADRELGLLGAVGYWAFDIAALWMALHAFGTPPPVGPVVMAYFVGQLANVIPLPGGVGGVEGGMIGALIAFGASGSLAVLGVLAYRLISFWLPTVPGGVAYVRLRATVARWRAGERRPHAVRDSAGQPTG